MVQKAITDVNDDDDDVKENVPVDDEPPAGEARFDRQTAASADLLVQPLPPKATTDGDDSSVDDLDADDVNAIDDRVRRVSPDASNAVKHAANNTKSTTPPAAAAAAASTDASHADKLQLAEARRHLLAESVAVALVTLKWRAMRPHDLEQIKLDADNKELGLRA